MRCGCCRSTHRAASPRPNSSLPEIIAERISAVNCAFSDAVSGSRTGTPRIPASASSDRACGPISRVPSRASDSTGASSPSAANALITPETNIPGRYATIVDPRPQRIYAEYGTFRTPVEVEDFLSFVMRLDGGALVSLDGASAAVGNGTHGDRVYGTKGQIAMKDSCRVFLNEPWEDLPAGQWVLLETPEGYPQSRTAYLDAFALSVLHGTDPPVPGRQGRRSLEIARGAYLSMQRGAPVSFPVED